MTGSAFQKLTEGISDPAPYYTDKELRQFVNAYKESSWSTKNYLKPSTATFKPSIFEWEKALRPLRNSVLVSFYRLKRHDAQFYYETSNFLRASIKKDQKELNDSIPFEHYWFNEECNNLQIMDKLMGHEFTPDMEQAYDYNSRFLSKMEYGLEKIRNLMVINWYDLKNFRNSLIFENCTMHDFTKKSWKNFRNTKDAWIMFHQTNGTAPDAIVEEALIENQ